MQAAMFVSLGNCSHAMTMFGRSREDPGFSALLPRVQPYLVVLIAVSPFLPFNLEEFRLELFSSI